MRKSSVQAAFLVALTLLAGACGTSANTPTSVPASATSGISNGDTVFTLEEGLEHDICGIGVAVKFIPATNSSSKADYAVVYGGPVNKMEDKVQNHTASDPLPDNAAHAVTGTTITVYGKRFAVEGVATSSVQLRALC